MAEIHTVFYVSRATSMFDNRLVQSILQISRRNNAKLDVTGCLLFSGRCFAQVLEGEAAVVASLAARIAADPRHANVRFLREARTKKRQYDAWSMGFLHDLTVEDDLETLLLIPDLGSAVVDDIMARMRPDTVMGALS